MTKRKWFPLEFILYTAETIDIAYPCMVREAAKKVLLLMIKGRAIKEKGTFFGTFLPNVPKFQRPLSSRGEGGKALMARPLRELREEFFL